jgi:hypothetical protein
METCEKTSRVSSYEFSATERMTYDRPLHSMTGQSLNDFLADMAMLQEAISGRHFYEVPNARMNMSED